MKPGKLPSRLFDPMGQLEIKRRRATAETNFLRSDTALGAGQPNCRGWRMWMRWCREGKQQTQHLTNPPTEVSVLGTAKAGRPTTTKEILDQNKK